MSDRLEKARRAAMDFALHFEFPSRYIEQLKGNPVQEPSVIDRDGVAVEVFRWLGHGRGDAYVQVEMSKNNDDVTVYGGFEHREFGPWKTL